MLFAISFFDTAKIRTFLIYRKLFAIVLRLFVYFRIIFANLQPKDGIYRIYYRNILPLFAKKEEIQTCKASQDLLREKVLSSRLFLFMLLNADV